MKLLLIPIFTIIIIFSVIVYTESTSLENKTPDIIFQRFVKDIQKHPDGNELITFGVRYMEKGTRIDEIQILNMKTKGDQRNSNF